MDSKILKIFKKNNGFLRAKDLTSRKQRLQLNKLIDSGLVIKLKRGLYCLKDYTVGSQDKEVFHIAPSGVLCLFSAWHHYGLTTTMPFEYHIAIERNTKITVPSYPPMKIYRWIEKFYQLGALDNNGVRIYDIEKSVCDAVRFRNKTGLDIAIEVVRNYLKRKDRDLNKLAKYAQLMRIETVMQSIIMPML